RQAGQSAEDVCAISVGRVRGWTVMGERVKDRPPVGIGGPTPRTAERFLPGSDWRRGEGLGAGHVPAFVPTRARSVAERVLPPGDNRHRPQTPQGACGGAPDGTVEPWI